MKRLTRRIVAPLRVGSIPTSHPIFLGRSQVGKARDFDSRMRWFESSRPSQRCDPLAQSVEHLTFNQGVPSSSLGWITIFLSGCGGIGRRTRLRIWRLRRAGSTPVIRTTFKFTKDILNDVFFILYRSFKYLWYNKND